MSRLDVRRALLQRGWQEAEPGLVQKATVEVAYSGPDVFVTGPARGRLGRATVNLPSDVPARVIVALCESWTR